MNIYPCCEFGNNLTQTPPKWLQSIDAIHSLSALPQAQPVGPTIGLVYEAIQTKHTVQLGGCQRLLLYGSVLQ